MPLHIVGYARTRKVDELCERCWRPSLIHVTILLLLPTGVTEHDRGTKCVHCDRTDQ